MPALITIAYVSLLVLGLIDIIRGPFYPDLLKDLEVSATAGGLFFGVTSLFSFFGSWSSHRFLERRSSLSLLMWTSLTMGLGFAAVSIAPDFTWVILSCMLFGYAFGALNLAQNALVCEVAPVDQRRRYLSGLHMMYGIAALVAPMIASLLRWQDLGWRQAFLLMTLPPIALSLVVWMKFSKSAGSVPSTAGQSSKLRSQDWRAAILFGLLMAGYLWAEISLSTRLVMLLRNEMNYPPASANAYLTGFFALLVAGRAVFGLFSFRSMKNVDVLRLSAALSAVFYGMGLAVHPAFFAISGLTMGPFFPAAMDEINVRFHERASAALGFILGFGSLSVVVMHLALGWLTDVIGLSVALYLCVLSLILVATALTFSANKSKV